MFGIFDPEYSRNKILRDGLLAHGIDVVVCFVNPRTHGRWEKYFLLVKRYVALPHHDFSAVLVAFPGQTVVPLARLLFRGLVIYDAFISLYDSSVFDRKTCSPRSVRAYWNWFLDWQSIKLAHLCLFDTQEHITFFHDTYHVSLKKCLCVYVGSDASFFTKSLYEEERVDGPVIVQFYGSFIPLQGVQYIVEAIPHIPQELDVVFRIVGGNEVKVREYRDMLRMHHMDARVDFVDRVPKAELPGYIAQADIALGIFGDTPKTQRVIPNKVFECAVMGKPIITADTPAIREVFADGENIMLCRHADGKDLARVVCELVHNAPLRAHLGAGAFELSCEKLLPERVVVPLLAFLK